MKRATGTREWAASTCNIQRGCEHGCWYCYAKAMAVRFGRCTPAEWTVPVPLPLCPTGKRAGRIMFPSTHDVTPANINRAIPYLQALLLNGNDVLIVSKPSLEVTRIVCGALMPWQKQIEFRFTIGSARPDVLAFWEPGASPPWERVDSLRFALKDGYRCSVSVEPMLDCEPEAVLMWAGDCTSVWLGRANYLKARLAMNDAPDDVQVAGADLMRAQSDDWIRALYAELRGNPVVRWKDSIRRVVGLPPIEDPA